MGKNHCKACNTTFVSLTSFDMHRAGNYEKPIYRQKVDGVQVNEVVSYTKHTRRCMTEQEMRDAGMKQGEREWWNTGREMPTIWKKDNQDQEEATA